MNDEMMGHGKFISADGKSIYEGEWVANEKHGVGNETFADGSKYIGDYEHGTRTGKGTFAWSNGQHYTGEFHNDEIQG